VVFSLFGGFFFYLVAYCAFGWTGVIVLAVVVGLLSLLVRSEIAASRVRQARADEQWIQYWATYGDATPQRRSPRRGRGGVR
jgi:hypothetical protein